MARPTFGSSSGRTSFAGGYPQAKAPRAGQLTVNQALSLAAALNKEKRRGFLSDILHGGMEGVSFAMRQLLRPSYGMAEGMRRALEGEGFDVGDYFKGFSRGVQLKTHTTFANVLDQEGILEGHGRLRGVAGFGLDVLTDPTLPLQIAATVATGGVGGAAILSGRLAMEGFAKAGATAAAKHLAAKEAVKVLEDAGEDFTARKGLAQMESYRLSKEARGEMLDSDELDQLTYFQTWAKQEEGRTLEKRLQARYNLPFTGKSIPLTPRTVKAPSLERTARGGGIIGAVPGMPRAATIVGKTFRHGFLEEDWAKPLLMSSHASERLFDRHVRVAQQTFSPYKDLGEDQIRHVLSTAEKNPHLVQGPGRVLNEEQLGIMVDRGQVTDREASFLRDWHKYWEYMRAEDKGHGVIYKKELGDKIYVPHIYMRDGGAIRRSDLAEAGYIKERRSDLTLDEIQDMVERGVAQARNWETNPIKLAGIRTRRAAQAQSRETLLRATRTMAGVPSRVPHLKAIAKIEQIVNHHEARAQKWEWVYDEKKIWSKRMNAIRRARIQHRKEIRTIGKRFGELRSTSKPKYTERAREGIRKESKIVEQHHDNLLKRQEMLEAGAVQVAMARRGMIPDDAVNTSLERLGVTRDEAENFLSTAGERDLTFNLDNPTAAGEETAAHRDLALNRWKQGVEDSRQTMLQGVRARYPEVLIQQQIRAMRRADERLEKGIRRAQAGVDDQLARGHREVSQAQKQIDRAMEILGNNPTIRNPNIPKGWIKLDRKIGGEQFHFSPEIHEAMTRVETVARNEADMEEFVSQYDKWMSRWKVAVTSVNPGYRVRNTLSDFWNMYIAGVPLWATVKYGAEASNLQIHVASLERRIAKGIAKGEQVTLTRSDKAALQTFMEAANHGILSGLFQGDIQMVGRMMRSGTVTKAFLEKGNVIAAMARVMQTMNRNVEDWGRLTHFLYRRRFEKLGAADSAAWVKKAHFDYSELTPVERDKFRKVLPFYTWTRKNIPYQITQMVARPGKYATFPKVIQTSNYLATGATDTPMAQENLMPEWADQRWAFRVPFFGSNAMMMPMIGATDLAKLEHPSDFVGMLAPPLRVPFELAIGKTMMGQDLRSKRRTPISGVGASIFGMIPGADVGTTSRVVQGKKVESPGAAQWVKYLAGQTPMSNFIINQQSPVAVERRSGTLTNLGYLAGVPIFQRDLEQEQVIAQLEHEDLMKQVMRKLRDQGSLPESEPQKPSAFQQKLLKALGG